MFTKIIHFSVQKKLFVALTTIFLLLGGIYSMLTLPVDAVPDITNNQVQIVTVSPTLAPQEVEQLITTPIEIAMSNIMNVKEIRSVSRFGLSLVTVVFKENVPTLDARQLINEQIQAVQGEIPSSLGTPELMPITTGLGEIYQYVLRVKPGYEKRYDAMELRTIQDWIVKRQLSGIPGIVEINSFGGYLKQYEVALDSEALYAMNISVSDVFEALSRNNQNTGGSYIEKKNKAYYIRSEGMIQNPDDIRNIVVTNRGGMPVRVCDVATVRLGSPKRFGAMTIDGEGECVGGIAMMLKGANANNVTGELEKRVAKVQKMLPEGISVEPYLNRSALVKRNISTVARNLVEGAVIVFAVLILFLGNVRAGLIAASVIPLAMLFGFILMRVFGVSANLMSLGAIDFGIVVDGSIVILEGILAHLYSRRIASGTLTAEQMNREVEHGAAKVARSATFAVLIILIVFFPILTLTGIEGKYFTPMAQTLVFCIIGALLLSLTYVPMMASLCLKPHHCGKPTPADRFFEAANRLYARTLHFCIHHTRVTLGLAFGALAAAVLLFTRLGAEFIPTLDEGDFAMQMTLPAGSSLEKSIDVSLKAERILKDKFPEIKHVVAKIGTAEVPTDPMAIEDADVMIIMKPFDEWTSAGSRAEMVEKMKQALEPLSGVEFNFSQPIQLRFNELMTGAKADIAIKLYGEDMQELYERAKEAAGYIRQVPGASDVIVEQAMGLPQLVVHYDRSQLAHYGISIEQVNTVIRTAYAGETAGTVFENERRFDLVLRLNRDEVTDLDLNKLFVKTDEGVRIPVSQVADVTLVNGPLQINRDATKRRIVIGVNVRNADIGQVVEKIRRTLDTHIRLKPGYSFEYGGQFENLQNAVKTLSIVIPIALMLILLLLFFAFRSVVYALVVFSTVPLSLIGGVAALWLRGMPFSISAGVGFIALFGVAVLNGILMINHFNDLRRSKPYTLCTGVIIRRGCPHLLRPVFLTGLVASLGFVPMAVAQTAGAEVQRPLATVVIGGLIVSTLLTLLIIPLFYRLVNGLIFLPSRHRHRGRRKKTALIVTAALICMMQPVRAQTPPHRLSLDEAIHMSLQNHPRLHTAGLAVEKEKAARGEIWDPGSTTVSYAGGQLNGNNRSDHELTVEQGLGSLLTPFYRNALAHTRIGMQQNYRLIVEKEITAEVKRAWAYYRYAENLYALSLRQDSLAAALDTTARLRYAQGDITLLERNSIRTLATRLHTRTLQAGDELNLAAKRFNWACYAPYDVAPQPSEPDTLSLPKELSHTPSAARTEYAGMQVKEKKDLLRIARSAYFPELSVGYTRQKIAPLCGLNSWMVGVSFPLLFFPQHSRTKQARLELEMARSTATENLNTLQRTVDELHIRLNTQRKSLEYFHRAALQEAETLQRTALIQYARSETDIVQLVQSLEMAQNIYSDYFNTVYAYNLSVLELELYTDSF